MTARSDRYFNNTTKVMRFGSELFCPTIPPPDKQDVSAALKLSSGINPLDTISPITGKDSLLSESIEESLRQHAKIDSAFTIGAGGCIEIVRSPYSNVKRDAYLTPYQVDGNDFNPINLYKGVSFHEALPSSAISQSENIFDENPLGFVISNTNSFNNDYTNYSGITDTSDAVANICTIAFSLSTKQKANDLSFLHKYDTIFEDESVSDEMDTSKEEEEIEFSVQSPEVVKVDHKAKPVQDEKKQRRVRKNYNSDTTNILMDWFFDHDGKAPSNKIKKELATQTGKSVVQVSTWFQNARRRYTQTLKKFQILSEKYPDQVYNNQSFKAYVKSHK